LGIVGGVGGGRNGDLVGIDFEDPELVVGRDGAGVVAQWAFGEARTGFTRGNQLARELNEVGGQGHGRAGRLFEYRGLAEGDLFVEGAGFGIVAVEGTAGAPNGCGAMCGVEVDVGDGGVFVEADREGRRQW
jgi:hypothetical protein